MQNESYEVVAVVLPEEEGTDQDSAIPHTILVRIYEDECRIELDKAIQSFMREEKPESLYRTIPVGSSEDFVEYWIDFPNDATKIADKLRDRLSATASLRTDTPPALSPAGGTGHRPDGRAA